MKKNKVIFLAWLGCFIFGLVGAVVGQLVYKNYFEKGKNVFKQHYDTENLIKISPATLRKMIDDKDSSFVLVDLRSGAEFNTEHIVGAVNIPAVSMDESQIVSEFKKLPEKKIILYCYSAYCMLARQIGQVLADNGIEAMELNVGWSEWKYYWGLWNPGEDPKIGFKYLEKGGGGVIPQNCSVGKFGC